MSIVDEFNDFVQRFHDEEGIKQFNNRLQELTELSKEEARMIWHIANAFQVQQLDKHRNQLNALGEMVPPDSEQVQQWIKESVHEFDLLHNIKAKMMERIGERP